MRILFVTQWFDPEPALKGLGFAKALRDLGHDVEVLTGFPNYPGGVVYTGYGIRAIQREVIQGVRVTRVALFPSHDRSAARRVLNYLSFAVSASLIGLPAVGDVDVTLVYSPPTTSVVPALLLRILRGTPYLLDIQDLWPDSVAATEMVRSRPLLGILGWACKVAYSFADRISVLSPGFKRVLEARGVPATKIAVIYNWAEEEDIPARPAAMPERWPAEEGQHVILFAGTMGRAQGLSCVLEAARLLESSRPSVRFVLMGGGVEAGELAAAAENRVNVSMVARQSRATAAQCLQAADALLIHLVDKPLFSITIPSKTQAYLASGKPIVGAIAGDGADLVREARAGVTCRPARPEELASAIEQIVDLSEAEQRAMGSRGRQFYLQRLSKRRGVEETVRLLEAIAHR